MPKDTPQSRLARSRPYDDGNWLGSDIPAEAEGERPQDADGAQRPYPFQTSVPRLLAGEMLAEAMSARDFERIAARSGTALIVEVAHPDMAAPVADELQAAGAFADITRRVGASRSTDRPDNGCDKVAAQLGSGANVAGVSQAPERYLPSTLVAAADIRVRLGMPSAAAVAGVIEMVTGRRPRRFEPTVLRGLTFLDVCTAIRRDTTAASCVRRLAAAAAAKRAVRSTSDAPPLDRTHGYGEARTWGLALVEAVGEWRENRLSWEEIPNKAAVLGGPPGTGKTCFAAALAKSLDLPLFVTSAAAWLSASYLGDVIKALDTAFLEASTNGPAVLFIDELDSVPNRETLDSRYREYWTPFINALLLNLDSASSKSANLVVVGATNFPERLDPALVRPGRLNRILRIGLPDADAIVGILRQHLGDALPGEDLSLFGTVGTGATGAEIAGWARSAYATARSAGRPMAMADLLAQVLPPETRTPELVGTIARHEASHAVMTEVLFVGDLQTVSLVERGGLAGSTNSRLHSPDLMTADQVDRFVMATLAGRAADEIWGQVHSGSGGAHWSDLAAATAMLAAKIASWGLGGSLLYRGNRAEVLALMHADMLFRQRVEKELDRVYDLTLAAVRENAERIDRVARRLIEARVLGGGEVRRLIFPAPEIPAPDAPADAPAGIHA